MFLGQVQLYQAWLESLGVRIFSYQKRCLNVKKRLKYLQVGSPKSQKSKVKSRKSKVKSRKSKVGSLLGGMRKSLLRIGILGGPSGFSVLEKSINRLEKIVIIVKWEEIS